MNIGDRLERLENMLGRWMHPERATHVARELRSTGAPDEPVWVDCTQEQMRAFRQKQVELRARGFGDVLDAMGPTVLISFGDANETPPPETPPPPPPPEADSLPAGNSELAQPPALITETTSNSGHSSGEDGTSHG